MPNTPKLGPYGHHFVERQERRVELSFGGRSACGRAHLPGGHRGHAKGFLVAIGGTGV